MRQAHQPSAAQRRAGGSGFTTCPRCHAAHVRALTETLLFVHLGCPACRHVWSRPERRVTKRPTPAAALDFTTIR